MTAGQGISDRARVIAEKVEAFVRETVIPYEADPAPIADLIDPALAHNGDVHVLLGVGRPSRLHEFPDSAT